MNIQGQLQPTYTFADAASFTDAAMCVAKLKARRDWLKEQIANVDRLKAELGTIERMISAAHEESA